MTEIFKDSASEQASDGDAVGEVDRRERALAQEDLMKAKIGPEALAGRRSDLAELAMRQLNGDTDKKKKEDLDFTLKMALLNDYLNGIQRQIAELQDQIEKMKAKHSELDQKSQDSFERAEDIRELIEGLEDGVSPEERRRIDGLLKMKTEGNKSTAEIAELLAMLANKYDEDGRQYAGERDRMGEKIVTFEEKLKEAEKVEQKIQDAFSSEDPELIEATLAKLDYLNSRKVGNDAANPVSQKAKEQVAEAVDEKWDDKPSFETLNF